MGRNQEAAPSFGDECPVCKGSGWELIGAADIPDYGMTQEFARPCSKCRKTRRGNDRTGVPQQFYDAELYRFKFDSYDVDMAKIKKLAWSFNNKFKEWQKAGKGLYFWSKTPGSGKTFLSCCIGKSVMMRCDLRMRFTAVPDYLAAVSESYKRERGMPDESWVYRDCELLIFDDIGTQKKGEWQEQEIFRLVNERMNNKKITLYTSNMPPEKLNIDDRTIDRILKSSIVVQMPEESIRRKQAKDEQESFLAKMLR